MNYRSDQSNNELSWRLRWSMKLMERAITLAERNKFGPANKLAECAGMLIEQETDVLLGGEEWNRV